MIAWLFRSARRLTRDMAGMAAVEFALGMPIMVGVVMAGTEAANMAFASQKLGDLATQTADNISRYKNGISEEQITDTLAGMKTMTDTIGFRNNGRIIVSSIRPVVDGSGNVTNQNIRWQRCTGAKVVNSSYGAAGDNLGVTGMGPTGRKIAASADTEVIFVEVQYTYRPLISSSFLGTPTLSAIASMVVRDRNNNAPTAGGTASVCTAYTA
ncbi:MAG: TadE/TadG family type IV pilus assembly protein [Sphingobium sp.]|nr:TadE/TadG family type IV pilus assembly protein [Sphingobium sp.]